MTEAIANTNGAVRVVPTLTKEQALGFVKEPLTQLPAEWRLPVWDFWAYFEHLLPTQLALCTRLRRWHDHDELTLDVLSRAMDVIREPIRAVDFQFAAQVLAALATEIEAVRKADAEAERKRREKAGEKAYTATDFLGGREAWASMRTKAGG